ncbi:MAG: alkylphosphonate utilization protein [Litoreibacter sp.]
MNCSLCAGRDTVLVNTPVSGGPSDAVANICETCVDQLSRETPDADHFRSLATTMWSEDTPTQVLAARMLHTLSASHPWARDLSDQLYLDDETRAWVENVEAKSQHKDSNGVTLNTGDTVVLVKDLPVKGGGFTAKRGTAVHRISLVPDNIAHIEGRVEGQRIVILTEFVKKR